MGRWHAYYASRCGARIAGFLDLDREAASRLAARYPGSRAFTELPEMLRELAPDVLHICTPSATHVQFATMAMDASVHALVEKPLTPAADECEILIDRAEACGVRICPVHQFVFQDGALRASTWLTSLGGPVHIQAVICSAGGADSSGSHLDEIAAEILPHPLSLMASFYPELLDQCRWSASKPAAGEIRASGQAGGASLGILISLSGRPAECSLQITASSGSVYLDLFHGFAVREPAGVSRSRKILQPFETAGRRFGAATLNLAARALRREPAYPGLQRLIARFYAALSGAEAPPFSRKQIIAVARAKDEIVCSAKRAWSS